MSKIRPRLTGYLKVPGDKSVSHRALIFAALCKGQSLIYGLSPAQDCLSTAACLERLGLKIDEGQEDAELKVKSTTVYSPGIKNLKAPDQTLFAGNSGTTIRLLSGLLSGQSFQASIDGDQSLQSRPMSRVLDPLMQMGASINYEAKPGHAPFSIKGGNLSGINYKLPVASAQVQTALLLAGLQSTGQTSVDMPPSARDHTVRQFQHIGVPFEFKAPGTVSVKRLAEPLPPFSMDIPGDISSAAFFMVAAACLPGSKITLRQVGINPGRRLIIDILQKMAADISIDKTVDLSKEPVADITVNYAGPLQGATIDGAQIAAGIDEIPILALAGALCQGQFSVSGAGELRVKESDRLSAIVLNLQQAGVDIKSRSDGFDINGRGRLPGGDTWHTHGDHRLAMTGLIANLLSESPISVIDTDCISVSYPGFEKDLASLIT